MSPGPQVLIPDLGSAPAHPKVALEFHNWRDGLLVRSPNWLGDAIMTLPSMLQLKALLPANCGLFVACPKGLAPLFKAMQIVDWVLPIENAHSFMRISEIASARRLQAGVCVIYNNSLRDVLSLKLCGIPRIYGASARFRDPLLAAAFKFPKRQDHVLNKPHHAAKYLSMAYALGAPEWSGLFPEIKPKIEPELVSPEVAAALKEPRLLAVAAGAAYGDAKRWPASSFKEVCRWWIERGGTVAALGSKAERPIATEALEGLPEAKALNFAGTTKIEELILLLKASKLCLANDSGVMHLAAALGIGGVAVFGSTDPSATSPISSSWRLLFDKLDCAPCFKRECPKGTKECLSKISPAMAIEALEKLEGELR